MSFTQAFNISRTRLRYTNKRTHLCCCNIYHISNDDFCGETLKILKIRIDPLNLHHYYLLLASIIYAVTSGMPYIFALSYAQVPSLHSRCEDAYKWFFRSISLTLPLAFFPYYLHKEIALLLLLDYDLQQFILGQLPEQNVLHLQFSIFC